MMGATRTQTSMVGAIDSLAQQKHWEELATEAHEPCYPVEGRATGDTHRVCVVASPYALKPCRSQRAWGVHCPKIKDKQRALY